MMEFRLFNKKSLEEFVHSTEFEGLNDLPISRHRAISHVKNPRADEDDVLLIVAFLDGQVAGYLGILPDRLYLQDGSDSKVGWFSCIWVGPQARGQGLADQLIQKALAAWGNRILATEYVPAIKKIYDRSGAFNEPMIINGIRLYIRMDLQTILPPKKKVFQQTKGLLKLADASLNLLLDFRLSFSKKDLSELKLEYTNEVDDETAQFISTLASKQLFGRNREELNWMLKYPWLLVAPETDALHKKYYFSSSDKAFNQYCIKIRNADNALIAFIILSKRNKILKMPYAFFNQHAVAEVASVIESHILKWKVNTFTTYNPVLVEYFTNSNAVGFHKKTVDRGYFLPKLFSDEIENGNYHIQDGDGDCAFT